MNEIKVIVNFKNKQCRTYAHELTNGDYNSTKLKFEFDKEDGRKVFEMKDPKGELVLVTDIENNEVVLVGKDENGNNASLFNQEGRYVFEISLYNGDSKLSSASAYLNVKCEEVVVDGEVITPYLPIFDELINEVQDAIMQTNNLDIDIENSIITITKKDGTTKIENVKGEKGEKGDAGSIKFIIANELPTEDIDDSAIYMKPVESEDTENTYEEYIYVNGVWESLGSASVNVDLADYVKKTDIAIGTTPGLCTIAYNKWSSGLNIDTRGMISIAMAENNQIDDRSSKYQPIVPANLDYAVRSVVGGHITLTQAEYDALTTKDENTYYYIVEE